MKKQEVQAIDSSLWTGRHHKFTWVFKWGKHFKAFFLWRYAIDYTLFYENRRFGFAWRRPPPGIQVDYVIFKGRKSKTVTIIN